MPVPAAGKPAQAADSRRRTDSETEHWKLRLATRDLRLATGDWRLEGRALLTAIVFDFDGVIADTEPLHYRAFRDVLADEGVELTTRDYFDRYLGFTDAGVFREIAADRGYGWTADRIAVLSSRKADRFDLIEHDGDI